MKTSLIKVLSISLLSVFTLNACESYTESVEKHDMKVVSIKHPKHFKITLVDKDGKEHKNSSKRCGQSHQLEVGKTYTFDVLFRTNSKGEVSESIYTCNLTIPLAATQL